MTNKDLVCKFISCSVLCKASAFLLVAGAAWAGQLRGQAALEYVADIQQKLTDKPYYAVVLERRNRVIPTDERVDAVIFTRLGSGFRLIRRLDDDHVIRINHSGRRRRKAPLVEADNSDSLLSLIRENKLAPAVLVDKQFQEQAIVYYNTRRCIISWRQDPDNSILISLKPVSARWLDNGLPFGEEIFSSLR